MRLTAKRDAAGMQQRDTICGEDRKDYRNQTPLQREVINRQISTSPALKRQLQLGIHSGT